MATGYTADVQSGKIKTFSNFAIQCARAMGALITMRDERLGAPIPDELTPSTYHREALQEAQQELERLRTMTDAEIRRLWNQEREGVEQRNEKYRMESEQYRQRYEAMLAKVKAWNPPTHEHNGLKEFMVEQLTESIKFDCGEPFQMPLPESFEDWKKDKLARVARDVFYHQEKQAEEESRTAGRNRWLAELRASLPESS